jgi:hypothetical protein
MTRLPADTLTPQRCRPCSTATDFSIHVTVALIRNDFQMFDGYVPSLHYGLHSLYGGVFQTPMSSTGLSLSKRWSTEDLEITFTFAGYQRISSKQAARQ